MLAVFHGESGLGQLGSWCHRMVALWWFAPAFIETGRGLLSAISPKQREYCQKLSSVGVAARQHGSYRAGQEEHNQRI